MGTHPRWVQTPKTTNHFGSFTRSSSFCGSRSFEMSSLRALAISSDVRCLINTGLPSHLAVILLPSWTSDKSTSILAKASACLPGAIEPTRPLTTALPATKVPAVRAAVVAQLTSRRPSAVSLAGFLGSLQESSLTSEKSGTLISVWASLTWLRPGDTKFCN